MLARTMQNPRPAQWQVLSRMTARDHCALQRAAMKETAVARRIAASTSQSHFQRQEQLNQAHLVYLPQVEVRWQASVN
jgi:hypothetical protein